LEPQYHPVVAATSSRCLWSDQETWRASEQSIRDSVRNAIKVAEENNFRSLAFPLIGAGSGGFNQKKAKQIMLDEMQNLELSVEVTIVEYRKG
jgi:O-acetyl-ADP-ribose deacetylase (regulator of RNase III)